MINYIKNFAKITRPKCIYLFIYILFLQDNTCEYLNGKNSNSLKQWNQIVNNSKNIQDYIAVYFINSNSKNLTQITDVIKNNTWLKNFLTTRTQM